MTSAWEPHPNPHWDPNPALGTRLATSTDVTELSIMVVDRLTPTQVKAHDERFPNHTYTLRRADGKVMGGGTFDYAVLLTPELEQELREHRRKRALKAWAAQGVVTDLAQMDLTQLAFLRRLVGILQGNASQAALQAVDKQWEAIRQQLGGQGPAQGAEPATQAVAGGSSGGGEQPQR